MQKHHYLFRIKEGVSFDEAFAELSEEGFQDLYGIEDIDTESWQIGGWHEDLLPQAVFQNVELLQQDVQDTVDWEHEWAQFAPGFEEGSLHINLADYGAMQGEILLMPGPGFGNLSHPTTRLMLHLLAAKIKSHCVLDIGCGSGILALAAATLGAKKTYGIDISEEALAHAEKNCILNHLEKKVKFVPSVQQSDLEAPLLILINMTLAEQKNAWSHLSFLHSLPKEILSSGILKEQEKHYLEWTASLGWELKEKREEEGWLAFHFIQKK